MAITVRRWLTSGPSVARRSLNSDDRNTQRPRRVDSPLDHRSRDVAESHDSDGLVLESRSVILERTWKRTISNTHGGEHKRPYAEPHAYHGCATMVCQTRYSVQKLRYVRLLLGKQLTPVTMKCTMRRQRYKNCVSQSRRTIAEYMI